MKYLSISKTPYYIAYAVFENKSLYAYDKINLKGENELKRLVEWEGKVQEIIDSHSPTFLITHLLDFEYMMKKDLVKAVEVKTILQLVSEKNRVIYSEFKTDGWEKRIIGRITNARKIKFVNKSYDIKIDDVEIANAIILAEGVAHDRLQIAK
jgi:hypothetical protein